jgi:hypothetical protein
VRKNSPLPGFDPRTVQPRSESLFQKYRTKHAKTTKCEKGQQEAGDNRGLAERRNTMAEETQLKDSNRELTEQITDRK